MTNDLGTNEKTTQKGTQTKMLGGFLMVLGVVFALLAGTFSAVAAILFFGGLITLIIGIAKRDGTS